MARSPPTLKEKCGSSKLGGIEDAHVQEKNFSALEVHSMCNPEEISEIFSNFRSEKAALVCSIGFEGLLRVPRHHSLDDSLSI